MASVPLSGYRLYAPSFEFVLMRTRKRGHSVCILTEAPTPFKFFNVEKVEWRRCLCQDTDTMPPLSSPHQDELAELALKRVIASGAEYGDIRLLDSTTQTI